MRDEERGVPGVSDDYAAPVDIVAIAKSGNN